MQIFVKSGSIQLSMSCTRILFIVQALHSNHGKAQDATDTTTEAIGTKAKRLGIMGNCRGPKGKQFIS